MVTVWKYPVEMTDYFSVVMPTADILCVQTQGDAPFIWALVDTSTGLLKERKFRVAGTGHPIEEHGDDLTYIGTFQLAGGMLVFHLFEVD